MVFWFPLFVECFNNNKKLELVFESILEILGAII
jgi:hypothetical protein